MPDIGRVLNGKTPGIHDAAVASNRIIPPDAGNPYGQAEILIQNRGTEALINTTVKVSTGSGVVTRNITSLAPNAVQAILVPITRPPDSYAQDGLSIDARATLSGELSGTLRCLVCGTA